MNDKIVWIGFGAGMITSSCILNIALINNNYSDSLPKSMFLPTSAVVPYYINIAPVTYMLFAVGVVIAAAFLISHYYNHPKTNDDDV